MVDPRTQEENAWARSDAVSVFGIQPGEDIPAEKLKGSRYARCAIATDYPRHKVNAHNAKLDTGNPDEDEMLKQMLPAVNGLNRLQEWRQAEITHRSMVQALKWERDRLEPSMMTAVLDLEQWTPHCFENTTDEFQSALPKLTDDSKANYTARCAEYIFIPYQFSQKRDAALKKDIRRCWPLFQNGASPSQGQSHSQNGKKRRGIDDGAMQATVKKRKPAGVLYLDRLLPNLPDIGQEADWEEGSPYTGWCIIVLSILDHAVDVARLIDPMNNFVSAPLVNIGTVLDPRIGMISLRLPAMLERIGIFCPKEAVNPKSNFRRWDMPSSTAKRATGQMCYAVAQELFRRLRNISYLNLRWTREPLNFWLPFQEKWCFESIRMSMAAACANRAVVKSEYYAVLALELPGWNEHGRSYQQPNMADCDPEEEEENDGEDDEGVEDEDDDEDEDEEWNGEEEEEQGNEESGAEDQEEVEREDTEMAYSAAEDPDDVFLSRSAVRPLSNGSSRTVTPGSSRTS